jgi:hypothetical protein
MRCLPYYQLVLNALESGYGLVLSHPSEIVARSHFFHSIQSFENNFNSLSFGSSFQLPLCLSLS